ncbi:hypothetical protein OROMI_026466 [Orobanche minor]
MLLFIIQVPTTILCLADTAITTSRRPITYDPVLAVDALYK